MWQLIPCDIDPLLVNPPCPLSFSPSPHPLLSLPGSGELWLRLDVSPEVRDYLVEKPFIKYECYFYATDEDETADETVPSLHAKGSLHAKEEEVAVERRRLSMSVEGGVGEKGAKAGASCANGRGLAFAEFGARNLEIGGPLQVSRFFV